jgi:hypothetical protein
MLLNRIIGGFLTAASFIMLGLVMSSLRSSSGIGVQIMDRMGLPFVFIFIVVQCALLFIFVTSSERLVPALLLIGGTVLYMVLGVKGEGSSLQYSLYAGSAFSGLSIGTLTMLGGGK